VPTITIGKIEKGVTKRKRTTVITIVSWFSEKKISKAE
jgi:phage terminase large subunit-like protein